MTIIEFCEKYKKMNSDTNKQQMVRSHIKRTYCPVLEKRLILQMMLDQAKATSETGIRYIDMMTSKINYTLGMIALYTDLTVDKKDKTGMNFECYDALTESGVLKLICEEIGENEIKELSSVNSMLINNFERTEGSLEGFLANMMNSFGKMAERLADMNG